MRENNGIFLCKEQVEAADSDVLAKASHINLTNYSQWTLIVNKSSAKKYSERTDFSHRTNISCITPSRDVEIFLTL